MKTILPILLFVACSTFSSQTEAGPSGSSGSRPIAVDATGAVYTVGSFLDTVDFDPGPGSAQLISKGEGLYISKLDANGAFLWVKSIISSGPGARPSGMAIDATGHLYITGQFFGTQDFDPGTGVVNLSSPTATGYGDYAQAFVLKLDTSGAFIWAKGFGGTGGEMCNRAPAIDARGNIYITGLFYGIADFDPGPGTFNITAGTFNNSGSADAFITSLDANGDFRWAKSFSGANAQEGTSIAVSPSGYVYSTGVFQSTIDLDPGAGTVPATAAVRDMYISKLDTAGNYVWGKVIAGNQLVNSNYARAMVNLDAAENLIITGTFSVATDFDPGPGTTTLSPQTGGSSTLDVFILKLDSAGAFAWAKSFGGTELDQVFDAVLDAAGNIYATGYFSGTTDFDPDAGITNLSSGSYPDIFVLKLNAAGGVGWVAQIGDTAVAYGIAIDGAGSCYLTGSFASTVDFDPGSSTAYLATGGGAPQPFTNGTPQDAFVLKLQPGGKFGWARKFGTDGISAVDGDGIGVGVPHTHPAEGSIVLVPNPVADILAIRSAQALQDAAVSVVNMQGQQVRCWKGLHGNTLQLDMSGLAAGIYVLSVNDCNTGAQQLRMVKR